MSAVVALDQAAALDRMQLGGKGFGLAQMIRAGVDVPPGFVITTAVSRRYDSDGLIPADVRIEINGALAQLEACRDQRLGDPDAPLLVSVRSGAPVSMPGMMDTVLNLGITPEVRDALAERLDPLFAWDIHRRYLESFGTVVLGLAASEFDAAAQSVSELRDTEGPLGRLRAIVSAFEKVFVHHGIDFPLDPREALERAIGAVFRSWTNPRAVAYRSLKGIDSGIGTAVTVQSMVFGNRDADSATGVLFTRNPNTGEHAPFGDVLFNAQGEDVVSGRHATLPVARLAERLPELWDKLWSTGSSLEKMFGDMVDIEFTIESKRLYILQARAGKATAQAAARIRGDLCNEGVIQAGADAGPSITPQRAILDPDKPCIVVATGVPAVPGIASGEICVTSERAAERAHDGVRVVLVRPETSPDDIGSMAIASGIVTARGGLVSHAAVTARELGVPTVVGAEMISVSEEGVRIGETFLREGDLVTVDGAAGRLILGDIAVYPNLAEGMVDSGVDDVAAIRTAPEVADARASTSPVDPLMALHALRVRGLARTEAVAEVMRTDSATAAALLARLCEQGLVKQRSGRVAGWVLTEPGRADHLEKIRVSDGPARVALERADADFGELNAAFKQVCTDWQMRLVDGEMTLNAHDDVEYDAGILESLEGLHSRGCDLTRGLAAQIPRFGSYEPRFDAALNRCRGGDISALARPMTDSYHDVWMELHEDLLVSLGRARDERDGA